MGEKRRKPLNRKALVSRLYPYFYNEKLNSANLFAEGFGDEVIINPQLNEMLLSASLFSGVLLEQPIKVYGFTENIISSTNFLGVILRSQNYSIGEELVLAQTTFYGGVSRGFPYIFSENISASNSFVGVNLL